MKWSSSSSRRRFLSQYPGVPFQLELPLYFQTQPTSPWIEIDLPGSTRSLSWLYFLFIFLKAGKQIRKRLRFIFLEAFLVHVYEIIRHIRLHPVDVLAPLPQPGHFQGYVEVLLALGFDDDRMFVREFDDKVRIVVGNVAIGVHVIELEMHGQIVLRLCSKGSRSYPGRPVCHAGSAWQLRRPAEPIQSALNL